MNRLLAAGALLVLASAARADKLVLVAGGGDGPDGSPAATAKTIAPFGVDFGADGTTYLVEMQPGHRLRAITPKGELVTLAGTAGQKGLAGDGGPAAKALFNGPHSIAIGTDGCVYVGDTFNSVVRKYNPKAGTIAAFAGTGEKGFGGDGGPAVKAKLGNTYCVSFDPAGKGLYVSDLDNKRIRRIDAATGVVTTVAGNGQKGIPKDGEAALSQPLFDPRAHAVDAKGNLYILERSGHALRVADAQGKIRTVVGTGKGGAAVGKALESGLKGPKHLCIDRDGTVLIADSDNHRILRYTPGEEKVVVVAGTGKAGSAGVGGDPVKAELNQPHGVLVHPKTGEIYISDSSNNRVLKIVREK